MSPYYHRLRDRVGNDLLMMPAVAALIRGNDQTSLLLQRRTDGKWSLPAGAMEPGETPAEAVVREVLEETGLRVVPLRVVAVCGGERFRSCYDNGDQVEHLIVVFECKKEGGEVCPDGDESEEVRFVPLNQLPQLSTTYPLEVLRGVHPGCWFEAPPAVGDSG